MNPSEAARIERLARLRRIGGWILLVGGLVAVAAGGALVAAGVPARAVRGLQPALFAQPAAALALVLAVGAVAALVGLALYVIVPGLDPHLARRDHDRPSTILAALAAVIVLGNLLPLPVIYLSLGSSLPAQLPPPALAAALLGSQAALMIVLVWRVVRPGAITWADMGLTTDDLGRRLGQGAVGGLAIFTLSIVIAGLMHAAGVEQTQLSQFRSIQGVGPVQFFGLWLLFAIVAPICEEAFFRGYVFTALRGRYGRLAAYLGSSLLFALVHLNLPALLPILVMALGLAFLYDRSRSVVPGVVAHGLNNAVALVLVYGRMAS